MPQIFFRADGNEEIATGHIMRCLSIARACRRLGAKAYFIVSDQKSNKILAQRFLQPEEFPVYVLHSDYRDPQAELPLLLPALAALSQETAPSHNPAGRLCGEKSPLLFIDSYFVNKAYLATLKGSYPTAYLDDLIAFEYPVDIIINYDISNTPAYYHLASRLLLGPAYTPLRQQFQDFPYRVRPQVKNIFISTGGTDPYHVAGALIQAIFYTSSSHESLKGCHYHIVTSALNPHYEKLSQLSLSCSHIHIYSGLQDMAALMGECDLAISAGGTTLYELCAIGVPTISFVMSDNQLTCTASFSKLDIIPFAGDVRTSLKDTVSSFLHFMEEGIACLEMRQRISRRMRAFVDGKGSSRIADGLLTFLSSS